jgi:hypothetical protein
VEVSALFREVLGKLDRAVGPGIARVHIYRIAAEDPIPTLNCPPGLTVAPLLPGQMSALGEVFGSIATSELGDAQNGQSQCYGAWLSGRLVHYSWVQLSGSHFIRKARRDVDIKAGEFWIYECLTSPSARGLGIYPYVLTVICRDHLRSGGEGFIYTSEDNVTSQRGILKAGFTWKEILRGLRIGKRYYRCGSTR